ncbi:MAG: tripartite tricarboxylate transporter TctB family protein [Burkholderiales bacterium]|nr:tripartite tricarboxylate transporter TctB family protein [Burkholderiales bacterium]
MKVRNGKDFWAGLMFAGFGISFTLIAFNYPMGTAARMGPAYFPVIVGGLLAILGASVLFRSFISKFEHTLKVFPLRLPLLVAALALGGVIYFADSWFKGAPLAKYVLSALALALFFGAFGPKSLPLVLLSVLVFGYALEPLGLVLATVLLVVISAAGGHDFRKKEILILTLVLVLFAVLVFVKGLSMPYNLWPGQ